jgi:hypothetical protein
MQRAVKMIFFPSLFKFKWGRVRGGGSPFKKNLLQKGFAKTIPTPFN